MKQQLLPIFLSGLLSLSLAAPSTDQRDSNALFRRLIGNRCKAPEGTGSCQKTSVCQGISNPANLCPRDPQDVQCCVIIHCNDDNNGSGVCRSVKNNGCGGGGKFVAGKCPGNDDIQCCVRPRGGAPAPRPTPPQPTPQPALPAWPECKKTLSCTFEQIERTSMQARLDYVREMQAQRFTVLRAGDQFRAIEGVIIFFQRKGLGAPGSWVSIVDAAIVEAIQNGGAEALGLRSVTDNNPGTKRWTAFLLTMKSGGFSSRDAHDRSWAEAEEAATTHGKEKADKVAVASAQTLRWYKFTQLFRAIMRNRAAARQAFKDALKPPLEWILVPLIDTFLNWLTDITNDKPTICGSSAAWDVARVDGVPTGPLDFLKDATVLALLIPRFWACYRE